MKHKTRGKLCILLSLTLLISLFPIHAQAKTITNDEKGTYNGYDYEFWMDHGKGTMELRDDGSFSCEWSDVNEILFKNGFRYDQTKTHQQIGNVSITYECNYQPISDSHLAVYGWTTNPLVEFFIIESWGIWKPPGSKTSRGTITVNGGTYDIYEMTRGFQDSSKNYQMYFSVRQQKRTSGIVSVSEHFKAWEALGMKLGKFYEITLCVEGYQSSDKADVTKLAIDIEPYPTLLGDVNEDKNVNAVDFAILRQYILGKVSSISETADVNQDDSIDSIDFGMLRNHLLGIINLGTTSPPPTTPTPLAT